MKKFNVGQSVSILANLGVIAGIVFLALELRQNNDLLEASTRDAQNVRIEEYIQQIYTVPGLAELTQKARRGEPLSESEELQLRGRLGRQLRGFQAQWTESRVGAAPDPNPSRWRQFFYEGTYYSPPSSGVWDEVKATLNPGFVAFMEENVIDR